MGCKYVTIAPYTEHPKCSIQGTCLQMWRCDKDLCWKPLAGMDNCPIAKKADMDNLPKDTYKVLFIKRKTAYVQVGSQVVTVPYDGEPIETIRLRKTKSGYKIKEEKAQKE